MKTYVLLLLSSFTLFSCRVAVDFPHSTTPGDPYVQLKNGKKITGNTTEKSGSLFKGGDRIEVGDTSVKAKDVAFYSTVFANYVNVGRKSFATQISAGQINLYRYQYTATNTTYSGGYASTSTRNHVSYYIQKQFGEPVHSLSYKNLAPMLQTNTPEYAMLERYRRTRIVTRSLGYGSLALLVGGFLLAASNNDHASDAGVFMVAGSIPTFFTSIGIGIPNRARLIKSVAIANNPGWE